MANIKIAYCITLYNVLNKIIFDGETEDGRPIERKLPFNVKYKLQKDLNAVSKDYIYFENERNRLITEYGEKVDDKTIVKEENRDAYKKDILKVLDMEVERNFATLTDEEIESISDVEAECAEMEVFIKYLTEQEA